MNKNSYTKGSISPGPGKYTLVDEFDIIANNKKSQNFLEVIKIEDYY